MKQPFQHEDREKLNIDYDSMQYDKIRLGNQLNNQNCW